MNKLTTSLFDCPRDIPKAYPHGEKPTTDVCIKPNRKSRDSVQNIQKHWVISETASPLFVPELMWINAASSLFCTWRNQLCCVVRTKFNTGGRVVDQALQDQARLLLFEMGDSCFWWMWTCSLLGMDRSSPKWPRLRRIGTPRWRHCRASQSTLPEE